MGLPEISRVFDNSDYIPLDATIVPFHKDFYPGGEQLEHRKLALEL